MGATLTPPFRLVNALGMAAKWPPGAGIGIMAPASSSTAIGGSDCANGPGEENA